MYTNLKPLIDNHQALEETTQKTTKNISKDHHMEPPEQPLNMTIA
jgi:hypothetical protein